MLNKMILNIAMWMDKKARKAFKGKMLEAYLEGYNNAYYRAQLRKYRNEWEKGEPLRRGISEMYKN